MQNRTEDARTLTPEDARALRERQQSTITLADDAFIVQLPWSRDGIATSVELVDGRVRKVVSIAWGYDMDDPYAHVTTNASPFTQGSVDFVFTYSVVRISDPENGTVLFQARSPRAAASDEWRA